MFAPLWYADIVSLADTGYTQSDGFADFSEAFDARGGAAAGLHGVCFYTRQDIGTARQAIRLSLAFWGAPEGADTDMLRVSERIVHVFRQAGFAVAWDGTPGRRPELDLRTLP